ncbi:MAG: polysaccharide pyruvyl transferase family protein [Elusimicrobia bacterium]|nr:polysaccharide pyruvyl transferase family protein [Elusimicrobiota bacterium]
MILRLIQARLGEAAVLAGPLYAAEGAVPRFHPFKVFLAIRRSGALILGGGELFQSRTSVRSLLYYWALPVLARVLGRPVMGFSLALDPDMGFWGRWGTAFVLRGAKKLWVRDEPSLGFLAGQGGDVRRMPDVVWAWPVSKKKPSSSLRRVLWIPRLSALAQADLPTVFGSLPRAIEQGLLAFHPSEDGPALGRFRDGLGMFHRLETWKDPADIFERISKYDVVVTMRYHGLVAAVLAGRPVVAIPGHGKVLNLARELNVPTVDPAAVSTTDWFGVIRRAFEAGAPSAGDRPARAAAALEEMARAVADLPLHNC